MFSILHTKDNNTQKFFSFIMVSVNKKAVLFFLILLIFSVTLYSAAFAEADKIFKENSKAVVTVLTYDSKGELTAQGSGFIVRKDGAVVTNYHVISDAKDIKVKSGKETFSVEGIIYADKENDLVILKIRSNNLPVVKLGDISKANVGEKVYVISSPQGLENTISDGLLSGIREISPKMKILQITASISPGSSGGAVFNKNGEVIGVATFIIKEAQNLNFAMPVNIIKNKVDDLKVTALKDARIENYEKTAEYQFYLGVSYSEQGMHKEAIEAFKQVIKINPDSAEAYNNLGVSYTSLGMYKEAIKAYKQVIRIDPDNAMAHYNLGISYVEQGTYKEAIEAFKQAIRINPNDVKAHNNLGVSYGKLGMHKEKITAYKQAIRIKPDFADAHYNLGGSYHEQGMYKEAIAAYKQVIRIDPDNAMAHYNLGISYGKLGMHKEKITAYKQAIRINPDFALAHYGLGNSYGIQSMYKEAIEAFKQVIRINADDAKAHVNLGFSYLKIGNTEKALQEYKILKTLDPKSAEKLFKLIYP